MKKIFMIFMSISVFCFANPTYDVTKGALQNNSALCSYGYNTNCSSESENGGRIVKNITVELPSKYGAIAQSTITGGVGSSMNENSKKDAIKVALARCESVRGNGKCKITATVRNSCQALSEGKKGKYYNIFYGGGERNTEFFALQKCTKSGAKDCKILMPEECSLPEIPR